MKARIIKVEIKNPSREDNYNTVYRIEIFTKILFWTKWREVSNKMIFKETPITEDSTAFFSSYEEALKVLTDNIGGEWVESEVWEKQTIIQEFIKIKNGN
jgi:hypothetical protein